jgi:hypothetical protein
METLVQPQEQDAPKMRPTCKLALPQALWDAQRPSLAKPAPMLQAIPFLAPLCAPRTNSHAPQTLQRAPPLLTTAFLLNSNPWPQETPGAWPAAMFPAQRAMTNVLTTIQVAAPLHLALPLAHALSRHMMRLAAQSMAQTQAVCVTPLP